MQTRNEEETVFFFFFFCLGCSDKPCCGDKRDSATTFVITHRSRGALLLEHMGGQWETLQASVRCARYVLCQRHDAPTVSYFVCNFLTGAQFWCARVETRLRASLRAEGADFLQFAVKACCFNGQCYGGNVTDIHVSASRLLW